MIVNKHFGFREEATKFLLDQGFVYHDKFGWCHMATSRRAVVEKTGRQPTPWIVTIWPGTMPS